MKCIENIFYLIFSTESNKKICVFFRLSVPLNHKRSLAKCPDSYNGNARGFFCTHAVPASYSLSCDGCKAEIRRVNCHTVSVTV